MSKTNSLKLKKYFGVPFKVNPVTSKTCQNTTTINFPFSKNKRQRLVPISFHIFNFVPWIFIMWNSPKLFIVRLHSHYNFLWCIFNCLRIIIICIKKILREYLHLRRIWSIFNCPNLYMYWCIKTILFIANLHFCSVISAVGAWPRTVVYRFLGLYPSKSLLLIPSV